MNRTVSVKHDCIKFLESGQAPASEYGVWYAGMRGCPAGPGAATSPSRMDVRPQLGGSDLLGTL